MSKSQEVDRLEGELKSWGAHLARRHLIEGLLCFLAIANGVLLILFIIDWLTHIPYIVRLLSWGLALFFGARWFYKGPWRKSQQQRSTEELSLLVEDMHPEVQSRMISTLQFNKCDLKNQNGISKDLVEAMMLQTFAVFKKIKLPRQMVSKEVAVKWFIPVISSVLVWFLLSVLCWSTVSAYMQRLVGPWAAYPTNTIIESVDLPKVIVERTNIPLVIKASGRIPLAGTVEVTPQNGSSQSYELLPTEVDGEFQLNIPGLNSRTELLVNLGDAEYGPITLDVVTRPTLLEISMDILPPAYTGENSVTLASGSSRVLKDSKLRWNLKTSASTKKIVWVTESKTAYPEFKPSVGEGAWKAEMSLTESLTYSFKLVDGIGVESEDTPVYRVVVYEDKSPMIKVVTPTVATELAPVSKIPMEIEFRDDYGIVLVELRYAIGQVQGDQVASEDEGQLLQSWTPQKKIFILKEWWDNNKISVKEGDFIRVWFMAKDNAYPDVHLSRSSEILIPVISAEAYRSLLLQKFSDELAPVDNIVNEMKSGQRSLRALVK